MCSSIPTMFDSGSILDLAVVHSLAQRHFSIFTAVQFGFLTFCKLVQTEEEEELRPALFLTLFPCELSSWPCFPVGCSRGATSLWIEGNGGRAVCVFMCVCVSLKIEAVCLSHTVGPTSCFHCPQFTSQRKKGRRRQRLLPRCSPPLPRSFCYHSLICRPVWAQCVAYSTIQSQICEECEMKKRDASDSPAAPVSTTA